MKDYKDIGRFEKVNYNEYGPRVFEWLQNTIKYYSQQIERTDRPLLKAILQQEYDDILKYHSDTNWGKIYNGIKLPKRQTIGSAGYDFYIPNGISLEPGETTTIFTGIKVYIEDGWVLKIYPRSSMGNKGLRFTCTTPIIDSDYYNNETNEGHIILKIENTDRLDTLEIKEGERFCQGIFVRYGTVQNENIPTKKRDGGTGSTSQKE